MYLKLDVSEVLDFAEKLGATTDQLPFIMSLTMNRAANETYRYLTDVTWPTSIEQRNPSFIKAALRTEFSNKHNLTVSIYDRLGRASLELHAKGGTKTPRGQSLAVPSANVRQGAHGASKSQRPRNLVNSFRKDDRIYQKVGRGKSKRVRVMYFLKPSVPIPKDVPFVEDFEKQMHTRMFTQLPAAVTQAMKTKR